MVLSDVEETIYVVDVAEVTGESVVRVSSSVGLGGEGKLTASPRRSRGTARCSSFAVMESCS